MKWVFVKDRPIYSQIIEQMQRFIVSGNLSPGDKLLSVRELAQEAGVNPNTMQRALAEMERKQLLYSNRTSGRFVTEDLEVIQNAKNEIADISIKQFYDNMYDIGYTKGEIIELVKNYDIEEDNNGDIKMQ